MRKSKTTKEKYEDIINSLELDETQKKVLKSTWLDYLLLMNSSASKGWFSHNYSQIAVIIFSLLIPVIEKSKLNIDIFHLDLTIISVLGILVAALTALNRQLGFEEKWRHYRRTTETMRNEGDDFFALAGNYEKFISHKEAFKIFTTSVTSYKRQEVNIYIEEEKNRKKDNK
jgi:hypothetical protein